MSWGKSRADRGAFCSALLGSSALAACLSTIPAMGLATGCVTKDQARKAVEAIQSGKPPDELPVMLNKDLPFRYPTALYAKQVQGNVTLRIFIDRDGQVRPESTRVEESSGYPALDSAAIVGSQGLHFIPAKLRGEPLAVSILFPVFFRHPAAPPLAGDTVLRRQDTGRPAAP